MQGINGLHYMLTCHVQPKVAEEYCVWHRVHCRSVGQCGAVRAAPSHRLLLTITASPPAPTMEAPYVESCSAGFFNAQLLFSWKRGWICILAQHFCLFVPSCCLSSLLSLQRSCIFCIVSLFSIFSLFLVLPVSPGIWSKV